MNLQQLQQKNKELAILNAIAQHLNQELELEKALDAALRQTVELLQLKTGWIWLFNPESQTAYLAASHQLPPVFSNRPELLSGTCYCIQKYLTGNLENASNISEITCTRLDNLMEGTDGLRYHASVPLFSQQEKLGILNVLSTNSQELSAENLRLLYTIGDMLGIAIARARLFANSRQAGIVEERNRLAREIHDSLAQGLAAISLRLESIELLLEKDTAPEKIKGQVQKTLALTHSNLEEARRSVLDLRASPLEEGNLATALEKLSQELEVQSNIQTSFNVTGQYRRLPQRIEMGLFRITQEAINNVRQHAQAQSFALDLSYEKQQIKLSLTDNGQGFLPDQATSGFGLISMSERAKLLQGQLSIQSTLGKGTHLTISLPLAHDGTH